MNEKITACLVVCNEEKLIGRCLASLGMSVDEIIVAHDGPCTDKTLEIAEKFGAKILILPKKGDSDLHRPFVYGQAVDWILRLDADEFLSEELKNNLRRLAGDPEIDCYEFLWPCWNGERYLTRHWPRKAGLFRRQKISFLGIPHFVPIVSGRTVKTNYILEHRPEYDNYSWKSFITKWLPRAKNQAEWYGRNFTEIQKLNYQFSSWPLSVRLRK
jgi:glycosyltransferase involved in cell wall biosynthesis